MKARYEAVYVEVDECGVPLRLVWRGRLYRVLAVQDRWRYAGHWWLDGRGWRRAYWVVKAQRPQGQFQERVSATCECTTFELFRQGANWVLARDID